MKPTTYKFDTIQTILRVLGDHQRHKPWEIMRLSRISRPTVNKYLAKLVADGTIQTQGSGAHIRYRLAEHVTPVHTDTDTALFEHEFDYTQCTLLDDLFLKYDPSGNELRGAHGFVQWCATRNLDPYLKYHHYEEIATTLANRRDACGLLDATDEFAKHVSPLAINTLYYTDQYKRNEFGRGKLAEIAFLGKQLQHRALLQTAIDTIAPRITCLLKQSQNTNHVPIDAIAYTPPSLTRSLQILDLLDTSLANITLPRINLVKHYPSSIAIPQKSLKKRSERIQNAQNSIHIYDNRDLSQYRHLLLIDDFVGSGATLNETAKKIKSTGVTKVTGFAIVGNLDLSYDVIREM